MSEDLEDLGATKLELIEAIHGGANVKDILRLEAAIWRLFDRAHALHYFMRVRNELQQKNSHLRTALRPFAKAGELFTERSMFSDQVVYLPAAGEAYQIVGNDLRRARAALEEAEE